jgi:O-antigen ligase
MKTMTRNANYDVPLGSAPSAVNKTSSKRFQLYEYAFYLATFYSIAGGAFGITIPYLATSLILGLAILCALRRRASLLTVFRPVSRPMLCIASFIFIQKYIHGVEPVDLVPFVVWAAFLIIIQSISSRPRFFDRFLFATFAIGMTLVPFMDLRGTSGRVGLAAASALSNSNDLASWFGFCAVAFTIRALQTSRILDRLVSGSIAFVSLWIVGATVSRGAMSAIALSLVVALRKQLKRGFVPLFILVALAGAGFAYGAFDSAIARYTARGAEDTGRMGVLPLALDRFLNSPIFGVGVNNLGTPTPGAPHGVATHNSILFFALASGILPLLSFLAYCAAAFRGALHASARHPYLNYLMPLFVYCAFNLLMADTVYIGAWFIATFSACMLESRRGQPPGLNWQSLRRPPIQAFGHPRTH